MTFDYTLLTVRIIEKFGKHYAFAAAMGISTKTLSLKLNNNAPWKDEEMLLAMQLLEIEVSNVDKMFFTLI